MPHTRMSSDEIAERGQALFERDIRSTVEAKDRGKFLVLDVESGAYEIDRDELAALQRMRSRSPGGAFYVLRIGHPTTYRQREAIFRAEREASRADAGDSAVSAEQDEWEAVSEDGVA